MVTIRWYLGSLKRWLGVLVIFIDRWATWISKVPRMIAFIPKMKCICATIMGTLEVQAPSKPATLGNLALTPAGARIRSWPKGRRGSLSTKSTMACKKAKLGCLLRVDAVSVCLQGCWDGNDSHRCFSKPQRLTTPKPSCQVRRVRLLIVWA